MSGSLMLIHNLFQNKLIALDVQPSEPKFIYSERESNDLCTLGSRVVWSATAVRLRLLSVPQCE